MVQSEILGHSLHPKKSTAHYRSLVGCLEITFHLGWARDIEKLLIHFIILFVGLSQPETEVARMSGTVLNWKDLVLVHIEFKRLQTFLFEVPRLRDMLGANALIGETIRIHLPEIALAAGLVPIHCSMVKSLNFQDYEDPLSEASGAGSSAIPLRDVPIELFKIGILSRDGGHFQALFKDREAARTFIEKAQATLAEKLPGLLYEITVFPEKETGKDDQKSEKHDSQSETEFLEVDPFDLPQLQLCQESNRGVASNMHITPEKEERLVSLSVLKRKTHGEEFYKNKTNDIIGLLNQTGTLALSHLPPPRDLHDLCGGDYLAVIVADGNDMGGRYNQWVKQKYHQKDSGALSLEDRLAKEAWGERFWHYNRVAVRSAVVDALGQTFDSADRFECRPYQLLMLGGDDLLMVCQASCALPFIRYYAECLKVFNDTYCKGAGAPPPLTIGAGVVIATPSLPFYRLHAVAEEMAASAKRLYRSLGKESKCSTVDWTICTEAWLDDVVDKRMRAEVIEYQTGQGSERLILSQKPYRILGGEGTFEGILKKASDLKPGDEDQRQAARSQLRDLVEALPQGRQRSELAFRKVKSPTSGVLESIVGGKTPWTQLAGNGERTTYLTYLKDIVEATEITYLGKKRKTQGGRS
jgi:hypothetical protein